MISNFNLDDRPPSFFHRTVPTFLFWRGIMYNICKSSVGINLTFGPLFGRFRNTYLCLFVDRKKRTVLMQGTQGSGWRFEGRLENLVFE